MKHPLIPISLIVFVDILGLTVILPLLPFYAEKYGASPFVVGTLISSFAFFQFFSGPVLGRLSDRHGRKPVLLLSQVGTFFGFLILGFANSLWMLFLGRIIDGITAGNLTVAQAYISDVTPPKDRVRAFGIIGVSFGLGFLIGPAISGALVDFGLSAPIFASAGLSFISFFLTLFILPKHAPTSQATEKGFFVSKATWLRFLRDRKVGAILLMFFLFNWFFTSFTSGFALFSERRYFWEGRPFGVKEVSLTLAIMGLYGMILQGGLIGRLNAWIGERKLVIMGFLTAVVGALVLAGSHELVSFGIALAIFSFGSGVLRPALTSMITQTVEAGEQGLVLGISQSLSSIAHVLAPLLSGALIGHSDLSFWCVVIAMFALCGLALSVFENKRVSQ